MILAVLAAACGAACGTASPAAEPSPEASTPIATVRLPGTSVYTPLDPSAPTVWSLPPNEVTEPCPEYAGIDGGDGMMAETARLEPMLGHVLAYGGQHPDQFGTYGFVWHDGDDASVFVSFASNLDAHRAALRTIVEHPDELIVCQVAVAGEAARAIEATLADELEGRFISIGRGMGPIEVVLRADEEQLAGELVARYGDAVEVGVGALAYPLEDAVAVCADPPSGGSLTGIEIAIVAPPEPVSAVGSDVELTVTLTNAGAAPIHFLSGSPLGTILDPSGHVVSSSTTVRRPDIGLPVDLAPGASIELPLVVERASCDPRLGYVLPPGEYRVVATVSHPDGVLQSAPTPIVFAG